MEMRREGDLRDEWLRILLDLMQLIAESRSMEREISSAIFDEKFRELEARIIEYAKRIDHNAP